MLGTLAFTAAVTLFVYCLLPAQTPPSQPQKGTAEAPDHGAMDMGSMQHDHTMSMPGSNPAPRVSGTEWSVFNHRGAGWFLFLWGLTALIAGLQWPRRTWLRFVPPLSLLGLVEFLLLRNDPEAWPIGHIGFQASLKDPEVLQHRVFVVLLLVIAIVELLRAADRLPPLLQKFALPGLALFGGIYLFFHKHGGSQMAQMMSHPAMASSPAMQSMMGTMELVKHEHLWFSTLGFGLAAAKLLADTGRLKGRLGATLWSVFAIMLGVYMMGYTE
jgi:putative copper resistance protein D